MTRLASDTPARGVYHPGRHANQVLQEAHALRRRLIDSLSVLPDIHAEHRGILSGWLDLMPLPQITSRDPVDFHVLLDANRTQVTWIATGQTSLFMELVVDLFLALGVSEEERLRFEMAVAQLRPREIGTWLELSEGGFDGGWLFRPPISLNEARAYAPMNVSHTVLAAWARANRLDTCAWLRRSVGEGTPYTDLVIPLPDGPPSAQCATAADAIAALGVEPLPEPAMEAIADAQHDGLGLSIRLFEEGAAKLGIVVASPRVQLVQALASELGIDANDRQDLAIFEGTLRVPGPAYVEFGRVATGPFIEFHFTPRATLRTF